MHLNSPAAAKPAIRSSESVDVPPGGIAGLPRRYGDVRPVPRAGAHDESGGGRRIFLPDGERYDGTTLDDVRHGAGVCHYLNGDKYEGQVSCERDLIGEGSRRVAMEGGRPFSPRGSRWP